MAPVTGERVLPATQQVTVIPRLGDPARKPICWRDTESSHE